MSGPPELPGLIDASVWITSEIGRPDMLLISRPRPEMTPVVRVWSRPNGLPIARTFMPTFSVADWPTGSGRSLAAGASTCSTAMSLSGAVPTIVAG